MRYCFGIAESEPLKTTVKTKATVVLKQTCDSILFKNEPLKN